MATPTLIGLVEETINEIKKVCVGIDRVYVMFSGGRDSLVTLDLTLRALGLEVVEALFIDTGIATPGLKEYVFDVCNSYSVKLNVVGPDYDFFELVLKKGFPMIKYRWCKEYLKIKPLKKFVMTARRRYKNLILITGIRRDESWFKARATKMYDHPILGIKVYAPIFEWSKEHVIEYIKIYKLRENPLYWVYGKAYDCWCTVYKSPADFALLALAHPDFYKRFVDVESKLRSGGSALYYGGQRIYLKDIMSDPLKYLKNYPASYKCPFCRVLA
jgi:3'-phosphoadenosine 5'-phosphosulfate sulfotransferase (PAPS reductase)/FAD synthetase